MDYSPVCYNQILVNINSLLYYKFNKVNKNTKILFTFTKKLKHCLQITVKCSLELTNINFLCLKFVNKSIIGYEKTDIASIQQQNIMTYPNTCDVIFPRCESRKRCFPRRGKTYIDCSHLKASSKTPDRLRINTSTFVNLLMQTVSLFDKTFEILGK